MTATQASLLQPASLDEAVALVQRAHQGGQRLRIRAAAALPPASRPGVSLLVTAGLDRIIDVDLGSQTVTVQAGRRLDDLEQAVRGRSLTLGHGARRSGHRSVGGVLAADDEVSGLRRRVVGLRAVRGSGEVVVVRPAPRRAVGPDVTALVTGLRGTGLLLLEATLRLDRLPETTVQRVYAASDPQAALALLRRMRDQDLAIEAAEIDCGPQGTRLRLPLEGPSAVVSVDSAIADELAAATGARALEEAPAEGVGSRPRFLSWHDLGEAAQGHVEAGRRLLLHGFAVEGGLLDFPPGQGGATEAGATSDDTWIALEGALIAEMDPRGTFVA
jgi:FAD/FMN-containing dehydrogenase